MPINYAGTDTLHNEVQLQTDGDTDNAAGRVAAAMALKDNSVWINNRAMKNDGPTSAVGPITSTNGFVSNGPLEINGWVKNQPMGTLALGATQTLTRGIQTWIIPTPTLPIHQVVLPTTGMQEGDWFEFFHPNPLPRIPPIVGSPGTVGEGNWQFTEEGAGGVCYLDSAVELAGVAAFAPAVLHFKVQLHASPILGNRWQLVDAEHLWIRSY